MKTSLGIVFVVLIFLVGSHFSGEEKVTQNIDETFDGISQLEVRGSFLSVEVEGRESNSVHFTGELTTRKKGDDTKIMYEVDGKSLVVWIERDNKIFNNISGKLKFEVPKTIKLDVKNSSGGVSVQNLINKNLQIKTSSGGIRAEGISGNLKLQASSGGISLSDLEGNADVTTSSGGIRISNIEGKLTARSSSGGQSFESIEGSVSTSASSGSIRFTSVEGSVNANTSSGSIKVRDFEGSLDLVSSSGSQYGEDVELKTDSKFHSVSGSITMHLDNSPNDLRFDLHASSGGLHAFDSRGDKSLQVGQGDILVKGTSSSGSQRYN